MLEIECEVPTRTPCSCCNNTTVRLTRFVYRDGDAHAVYYAQFTEGHEDGTLSGLISLGEWGDNAPPERRVAFPFALWRDGENYNVRITNAEVSPWRDVTLMGRILDRTEALQHAWLQEVFQITDQMTEDDPEVRTYFGLPLTSPAALGVPLPSSCCGASFPLDELELSFRHPDCIAALPQTEREARCWLNDDLQVLDDSRFFVRCVIPFPIQLSDTDYAIGAWAEVDEATFKEIGERWTDEAQASLPPFPGHLANAIPLNGPTLGKAIGLRLTGPSTRPHILVADEDCDLYREQRSGISVHRANAYSSLFRAK